MEKLEIIKARNFGDKFNELTSFIYDNFGVLWKWALAFVAPCAMLMTALILYMPDATSTNVLKMILCVVLASVLAIVLNTLVRHHFEDGIELRKLAVRNYIAEILKNIGIGIVASLAFDVLVSLIAFAIEDLLDVRTVRLGIIFTLSSYSLIVSFFFIPVFYVQNSVIIEDKSTGDAIKRAIQLMLHNPFKTVLFLFVMAIIGCILPSIASIPYMIIVSVKSLFSIESGWLFSIQSKPIWEFTTFALSMFCFILTFLAMGVGMMFEYGDAVEKTDNVSFMKKYNNFENL